MQIITYKKNKKVVKILVIFYTLALQCASAQSVTSKIKQGHVIYYNSFESGDFGEASFVQGLDTTQGPGAEYVYVATYEKENVPALDGKFVAHFERPSYATARHAKLYKEWSNVGKHDSQNRLIEPMPKGGNTTASYRAWFFFKEDYKHVKPSWTNFFQFKEEGYIDSVWHQDPSWWLNIASAANFELTKDKGDEPVIVVNNWKKKFDYTTEPVLMLPKGKWFEVRADLYEGSHIDWYIDDVFFQRSLNSEYPVGRFFPKSNGWIFGIGHYDGVGTVLADKMIVELLSE